MISAVPTIAFRSGKVCDSKSSIELSDLPNSYHDYQFIYWQKWETFFSIVVQFIDNIYNETTLPCVFKAPSIWKAEVPAPKRNPSGMSNVGAIFLESIPENLQKQSKVLIVRVIFGKNFFFFCL